MSVVDAIIAAISTRETPVPTVTVRDETLTGKPIEQWTLPGLPDAITARELLRLRVREEVARFNAAHTKVFTGLVQPVGATWTGQGYVVRDGKRIDWEAQAQAACDAFYRNGFVMLVDDRQVDELDEVIDLRADVEVSFIKLIPLVGG